MTHRDTTPLFVDMVFLCGFWVFVSHLTHSCRPVIEVKLLDCFIHKVQIERVGLLNTSQRGDPVEQVHTRSLTRSPTHLFTHSSCCVFRYVSRNQPQVQCVQDKHSRRTTRTNRSALLGADRGGGPITSVVHLHIPCPS